MKVRDLMSVDVVRVDRTATVRQAMNLMSARRVSSVLVDPAGTGDPWGIVTTADLVHKVAARGLDAARTNIVEIMSPALLVVDGGLDVGYASRLMKRYRVRHLPVIEESALAGVLSYHDVLRCFSLLHTVPFLRQLCVEDLIALLQLASVRRCRRGEVLMEEGSDGHDLYVLEEGEMTVSTRRAGRIARIRPGETFGEMELFGGRRSAAVRAARDSRLLVLDGGRFLALLEERQHLAAAVFRNMSRLLSERLKHANRYLFLRGIWSHRLTMLRAAAAVAGLFAVVVLSTAAVSEKPAICTSCHYMRPYHASWTASPHKGVACTTCHTTYGVQGAIRGKITGVVMAVRYATGTYDPMPEARVDDASCLRSGCHDRGRIDRTPAASARFDHARHLRSLPGFGTLQCTSCHNHRGQEEHFSVAATTCFLCHFPAGSATATPCLACHDFSRNDPSSVTLRVNHAELSPSTDCLGCHRNVSTGSSRVEDARCTACHLKPVFTNAEETHRTHIGAGVDCFACHSTVGHPGQGNQILAGECVACHGEPHAAQERLYLGEGGTGVLERPALMFYRHVECTACHGAAAAGAPGHPPGNGPGSAKRDGGVPSTYGACRSCHEIDAERQARMWKLTIARSAAEVGRSLDRFRRLAGPEIALRHPKAVRLYDQARNNYEVVITDPSAGIHNFRYAQDVLIAARQQVEAALADIEASGGGRP